MIVVVWVFVFIVIRTKNQRAKFQIHVVDIYGDNNNITSLVAMDDNWTIVCEHENYIVETTTSMAVPPLFSTHMSLFFVETIW